MTNIELFNSNKYISSWFSKYLMLNILIIIKIVLKDNNFIIISFYKFNN